MQQERPRRMGFPLSLLCSGSLLRILRLLKMYKPDVPYYIYGLVDPLTGELKYIGQTSNLKQRLSYHIHGDDLSYTPKNRWISGLRLLGEVPIIKILKTTTTSNADIEEINAIKHYEQTCPLTNIDHCSIVRPYRIDVKKVPYLYRLVMVFRLPLLKMAGFYQTH